METETPKWKAGFVALLGRPNAGKSTLMNTIIGEKISIVSDKPQTTRRRVTGIWNDNNKQIVFIDAPGVIKSQTGLNQFISDEVDDVIKDADVLAVLIALDETSHPQLRSLLDRVKVTTKPYFIVFTKSDLKPTGFIKELRDELVQSGEKNIYTVTSEPTGEKDRRFLLDAIADALPDEMGPLYPDEDLTTERTRDVCGEMVREKCFELLHHELPYGLAVRVQKFDESRSDLIRIFADIMVDKENHKAMVIGEKGSMIKAIGQAARIEIEKLLGTKVFLSLQVVFRKNWTQKNIFMKELGYVRRNTNS